MVSSHTTGFPAEILVTSPSLGQALLLPVPLLLNNTVSYIVCQLSQLILHGPN